VLSVGTSQFTLRRFHAGISRLHLNVWRTYRTVPSTHALVFKEMTQFVYLTTRTVVEESAKM
jgi:hypothetical protein